jgi:pimeloyl-ACP methyl ester carboxylesterase
LIGVHAGLRSTAERTARRENDERWRELLLREGTEAFVAQWEAQPLWATQGALDAGILRKQREQRLRHAAPALASAFAVLGLAEMPDYWDAVRTIAIPVTLAVGEHDKKFAHIAERLMERIPRARRCVVPGVGHNLLLEAPWWVIEHLRSSMRTSRS